MTIINNKVKQFYKGNWGKPTKGEHALRLKKIEIEPNRIPPKKKPKNKIKKPFEWDCCPFCQKELLLDERPVKKSKWGRVLRSVFDRGSKNVWVVKPMK